MTEIIANIIGLLGIVAFNLCYQFKKRKHIIAVNILSRVLYCTQYIMLGALSGAVLDCAAAPVLFLAEKREHKTLKKYLPWVIVGCNLALIGLGVLLWEDWFSLLAIVGILLETAACWFVSEKKIRLLSILAAPLWMAYNLHNLAFASAVGNMITIVSIGIALWRYDLRKKTIKE